MAIDKLASEKGILQGIKEKGMREDVEEEEKKILHDSRGVTRK